MSSTLYPPGSTYDVGGRQFFQGRPVPPPGRTYNPIPGYTQPGGYPQTLPGLAPTEPGAPGAPGGPGPINIRQSAPDYHGILDQYTADWKARLSAGLASNEAQRQSRARAAINRLGVRDAASMLPQLQKYGLTAADLQLAQDNPWSDLKAITQQAERGRGQAQAEFAARGGFRSGGTAQAMENIEQDRARAEAGATQETLAGLSSDAFNASEWERQQRDEMESRTAGLESQLAQTYQPYSAQARWDPASNAYRYQNTLYDQYGNVVG